MIILTTSTNAQELKFIPRDYAADSIVLTDEETNTSTSRISRRVAKKRPKKASLNNKSNSIANSSNSILPPRALKYCK